MTKHVQSNPKLAKLNWEKVLQIRYCYAEGFKISQLAKAFGVSTSQLYKIVNNQTWKR